PATRIGRTQLYLEHVKAHMKVRVNIGVVDNCGGRTQFFLAFFSGGRKFYSAAAPRKGVRRRVGKYIECRMPALLGARRKAGAALLAARAITGAGSTWSPRN